MLKIRPEQMKAFEADALRKFEDEMVEHSKEFTPQLCKVLGDAQLRVLNVGQFIRDVDREHVKVC